VIGGSFRATEREVLTKVEEALRHEGDDGYGPRRRSAGQSRKFEELVSLVLSCLDQALGAASLIESFWLKEGDPDYPVFWNFAFVIAGPTAAVVFIGSSSD
jgi:hypothetical protein